MQSETARDTTTRQHDNESETVSPEGAIGGNAATASDQRETEGMYCFSAPYTTRFKGK